ncbi:MAG TPA: hypothetical protein VHO91_15900 [Rhodopila sp.]|nr:hypothetical protein [Rhodopila sp.]
MSAKRPTSALGRPLILAVNPPPLGTAELRMMTDALVDVAPGWTVDLLGICVEEATLVVLPEGGDDRLGPSFILSRESFSYRVDQVHWDMLAEIGQFTVFSDAVAAIRQCVRVAVPLAIPPSVMRH